MHTDGPTPIRTGHISQRCLDAATGCRRPSRRGVEVALAPRAACRPRGLDTTMLARLRRPDRQGNPLGKPPSSPGTARPGAGTARSWPGRDPQRKVFSFHAASPTCWSYDVTVCRAQPRRRRTSRPRLATPPRHRRHHGLRVYAMFANGDLVRWTWTARERGPRASGARRTCTATPRASRRPWNATPLVQYDQGSAEDHLSKLIAIDGATGDVQWQAPHGRGQLAQRRSLYGWIGVHIDPQPRRG